jgi:cysteine desulfurase
VVTWAAEHQAVLAAARALELDGFPVTVLPVQPDASATPGIPVDAGLVSIALANNEVGTIQPAAEVAANARETGALVHLDACQGAQWIAPPVAECDLASFSGHKLGAGRGGLLVVTPGLRLQPLLFGGPQEWGRRAGREDVAAAVAVSVALEVSSKSRERQSARVRPLAERLQHELERAGGRPTGSAHRLPNFATVSFEHRRGEDMLLALDREGIAASSGSACASGSLDPSHVLLAIGLSLEAALGSLRLTLSYASTEADVNAATGALRSVLASAQASV